MREKTFNRPIYSGNSQLLPLRAVLNEHFHKVKMLREDKGEQGKFRIHLKDDVPVFGVKRGALTFRIVLRHSSAQRHNGNFLCFVCFFVACGNCLREGEAADGVFADAAEIECAIALDNVCYLGVAVGGAVLEVFDNAALCGETKHEGVALWGRLQEFR